MAASSFSVSLLSIDGLDLGGSWTSGLSIFALAGLAWLLTYALHSTLLLGSAWIATRRMSTSRAGLRERVWKFALLAAFATSSLQVGLGFEPLGGRLPLRRSLAQSPPPSDARTLPAQASNLVSAARDQWPAPGAVRPWPMQLAQDVLARVSSPPGPGANSSKPVLAFEATGFEMQGSRTSNPPELEPSLFAAIGPWVSRSGGWTQWAFASCVLGAFGGLLLFALLWVRLNGCLRDRVALEHGALAEKLRELCRRAGIARRVRLSVAPSLGAPISMGMFRPEICVPPRVLLELSDEEQEVLLAHELAHVVRRDPLWLAACRLCEGVFFFQPLNRVARREIEDCAEFMSDAWAVRQTGLRFSLASCLTRIAEWIVGERRSLPAPAMAQGRSRLRHRVELLLDESSARELDRRPAWLGAACLGFSGALIAVVPCVSATEELLELGDRGGLSFLPDHGAEAEAKAPECTEPIECEEASEPGSEVADAPAAEAIEAISSDGFEELGQELDALAAEIALLRAEVAALDLGERGGPFAREVDGELKLLEMKLVLLRELSSRLEVLRSCAGAGATTTPAPLTEHGSTTAATVRTTAPTPTTAKIPEEITK